MNRATWWAAICGACVAIEAPELEAPLAERAAAVSTLEVALDAAGLPAASLLRQAAVLGSESGWDVVQVPAWPLPGQAVRVVLVANTARPGPAQARLRLSTDGWGQFTDSLGSVRATAEGVPYVVFPPMRFSQPVAALFAVEVGEPWGSVWLNRGGADYGFSVAAAVPLSWMGELAFVQEGLPRAGHGDVLFEGHSLTVTADTWPLTAGVDAALRWTVDGVVQPEVPMALDAVGTGVFGANARWTGTLDTGALPVGAVVAVSVRARNAGAALVDDRGGAGYQLTVAASPELDWWQVGRFGFSECHWNGSTCVAGWQWQSPLLDPFLATPSEFQAGGSMPYPSVELYVPGVTVQNVPYDPAGGFLRVAVSSPFFSGDPAGAWLRHPLRFREASGNNLRYDWQVREHYAPNMPAVGVQCPPEGDYPFRFEVSTDGGRTYTAIGDGAWPDEGEDRTMSWLRFGTAPSLTTIPAGALQIADTAVGSVSFGTITLVNTSGEPLRFSELAFDQPAFSVRSQGCPAGGCPVQVAPGAQAPLQVRFAPTAAGVVSGELSMRIERVGACASIGTGVRVVSGRGL